MPSMATWRSQRFGSGSMCGGGDKPACVLFGNSLAVRSEGARCMSKLACPALVAFAQFSGALCPSSAPKPTPPRVNALGLAPFISLCWTACAIAVCMAPSREPEPSTERSQLCGESAGFLDPAFESKAFVAGAATACGAVALLLVASVCGWNGRAGPAESKDKNCCGLVRR